MEYQSNNSSNGNSAPATMTIKQRCADLCFYDTNVLTNRRLTQTQHSSSSLKTSFLGDSHDGDESLHRQI